MRKWIGILLCCLLLVGCRAPIEPTTPVTDPETIATEPTVQETTEPEQQEIPLNVYAPNDQADDFYTIPTVISELDAQLILDNLVEHSMLNEEIQLNSITLEGRQLNLDFNLAFADQLMSYGTAGERMLMGCVVNTFLSVYDADCVYITVNGHILESGHVIYDFPLKYFE